MLTNDDYLNIFHEIKNSITLINSSLQLVAKKHPEVQDFDYWKESMSEIDFLKNMVTQLSSARLCGHLSLMQVNLYAFMNQISDPQLLKQAIVNIVKNACEAMNGSGTVIIHVFCKNSLLHIAITDHGGGLPPALAANIFSPFITSKTGGSGLGLVITKQIIEAHHGSISCDSRPGDGCTFTIILPLTQN